MVGWGLLLDCIAWVLSFVHGLSGLLVSTAYFPAEGDILP